MTAAAFFTGYVTLKLEKRMRRICTSILIMHMFPLLKTVSGEDGALYITMRRTVYKEFAAAIRARGLALPEVTARVGMPYLLARFSYRPGLLIGFCLALGTVVCATLFCWRVDVVCLDNAHTVRESDYVDTATVKERLCDIGIGVGTFLPSLDVRSAEKRFLIGQEDVSWIALNRRGTVLCAEVRSTHMTSDENSQYVKEGADNISVGTNLCANADGIVRYWILQNGKAVVQHEQMVTRGTLLATGFYESKDGDILYRRARGKVFAETIRTLTAEIPRSIHEKTATGKTETRYTLSVFGHDLPTVTVSNVTFLEIFRNFRKKTGFLPQEYDTIIDEYPLVLRDGIRLPLTWKKETRLYYTEETRLRTEEEMQILADTDLSTQRLGMTDAVVLSSETKHVWKEDALTVTEDIHCIDNIAEEVPYYLKNDLTDRGK